MSDFSKRLSKTIEERGVSQKWLAEATHITRATISRYATSERAPDILDSIPLIATALGVSTDYLLCVTDNPEPANIPEEERVLLNCFRRASSDDVDTLWILLRKYMTDNEKEQLQQLKQQLQVV